MTTHDLYDRDDELSHCRICGGAEGTLPTDCPKRRLTGEEETSIWDRQLDYKDGQWVKRHG